MASHKASLPGYHGNACRSSPACATTDVLGLAGEQAAIVIESVAQTGERRLDMAEVASSNLAGPTKNGSLAQSVEQSTDNRQVASSNLAASTIVNGSIAQR